MSPRSVRCPSCGKLVNPVCTWGDMHIFGRRYQAQDVEKRYTCCNHREHLTQLVGYKIVFEKDA